MTSSGTQRHEKARAPGHDARCHRPKPRLFPLTLLFPFLFIACAHHPTPPRPAHARLLFPSTQPATTRPTTTSRPATSTQPATTRLTPMTQPTTTQPATRPTTTRPARPELAPVVRCGLPSQERVALTFDDGPYRSRAQTRRILDILRKKHVKATFFVLGRLARRYPQLIRRIHDEGHLIANHSWDHPRHQSRAGWITQLSRTDHIIRAAGVTPSPYYRPPHGITNTLVRRVAGKLGYTIVLYTLLSSDWRRPGVKKLVHQVTHRLHGGGIVVLHDGGGDRTQTIAALPAIIDGLRARGLEPVRLDRLLATGGRRRGCTVGRKK